MHEEYLKSELAVALQDDISPIVSSRLLANDAFAENERKNNFRENEETWESEPGNGNKHPTDTLSNQSQLPLPFPLRNPSNKCISLSEIRTACAHPSTTSSRVPLPLHTDRLNRSKPGSRPGMPPSSFTRLWA